ncbi:DUF2550 domain-containing protein [Saxibacter everestensis]|uniref:DUF2550 domain-containing protein n=1 Tax=Saxibacter everestensis TaxID=2909229 RepID=A0ABY8QNE1_9MICO|nr:DUF2550 domain-containing protein [Brevibacteriaceae bacterium ZFBP1038]
MFIARRRYLSRFYGSFDCSLFVGDGQIPGHRPRWRLGVAVYADRCLEWYPVFALRRVAQHQWHRQQLEIVTRDVPTDGEQFAVLPGALIVQCREVQDGVFRLAMGPDAYAGYASWLESAPPGHNDRMGHFT